MDLAKVKGFMVSKQMEFGELRTKLAKDLRLPPAHAATFWLWTRSAGRALRPTRPLGRDQQHWTTMELKQQMWCVMTTELVLYLQPRQPPEHVPHQDDALLFFKVRSPFGGSGVSTQRCTPDALLVVSQRLGLRVVEAF